MLNLKIKAIQFIGEDLVKEIKPFLPNFDKYSKIILVTDKIVLKICIEFLKKSKNYRKKSF